MGASVLGRPCHRTAAFAIRAFAGALEAEAKNGVVSIEVVRRLASALSADPGPLAPRFASAETSCTSTFASRQLDQVRRNYVGRVAVKNLADLLEDDTSGIKRSHLAQLFTILKIVIGEEVYETLQDRCADILSTLDGDGMDRWDAFYAHPDIRQIAEQIHVSLARSFRRFEPRKEWFLTIMNSHSASQSMASNAFVIKKREPSGGWTYFTEVHLARLLAGIFNPYRGFDHHEACGFESRWGVPPEKIFGPIFVEIAKIGQRP